MMSCTVGKLEEILMDYVELNAMRSKRRIAQAMRNICSALGREMAVELVDYSLLQRYAVERSRVRAPATVAYELRVLHKAFVEAEKAGIARTPIFPSVRVRNVREGFFDDREIYSVCLRLPPTIARLVVFLYLTGWRRGEATNLRWTQVDLRMGEVRLHGSETKSGRGRIFPFGELPELRELVEVQRRETSRMERELACVIPWVFWQDNIRQPRRRGERIGDFRKVWNRACAEAGCPGRLVHDLRRSAVRRLTRAGVPRSVAKQITGHRTDSIFERYDIVDERDLRQAVRRLSDYISEERGRRGFID